MDSSHLPFPSSTCRYSPPSPPSTAPESSFGGIHGGAPMRLLVLLHTAFRRELKDLKRVVEEIGGAWRTRISDRELMVVELMRRVEFFRSVYKYHCVAEAEVIFLALNTRVENIASTYYLQHSSTDSMFESIVSCLKGILDDLGNPSEGLQEVTFQIGFLQDLICQHMVKEEKQVFPLLMSHFCGEEQASLIWQFLCSFPVMLLADLFPWFASLLSSDEQLELNDCINNILTEDESTLKEVVTLWINKAGQESHDGCNKCYRSSEYPQEEDNLRQLSDLCLIKKYPSEKQEVQKIVENSPFDGLLLWHAAIRSDFQEILNKLNQARLQKISRLTSVIVQIKFLNEALILYSNILEQVFYPLLEDTFSQQSLPLYNPLPHKNEIGKLQKILYNADQASLTEPTFLANLCSNVESLVLVTTEHLSFQEKEVFPLIVEKYNHVYQQKLLIRSLCMLPLGLLKCMVTWFSSRLPKDKLNSVINGIEQCSILDRPFASLLHGWVRCGYSGKTSTENLRKMFNRTIPFIAELRREERVPCENVKQADLSTVGSSTIFTSRATNLIGSISSCPTEAVSNNFQEPRPMDHIYYFHKAIKKDLESLVLDATKLSKNLGLLREFTRHFHFVRSLYELHSETEDKVAFPALESNPNARNLTQSYSIDHELEAECFERVSRTLDEMSELYNTLSHTDVVSVDPVLVKYHLLCLQLEDSCKSLKKILEDHIRREETELWPLFREYFSIEEQITILGYMLGRTRAEILQEMLEWLMAYLTLEEQQAMMGYWLKATSCTKFNEWLREWWEGVSEYEFDEVEESTKCPLADDVNVASNCGDVSLDWRDNLSAANFKLRDTDSKAANMAKKMDGINVDNQKHLYMEHELVFKKKKDMHKVGEYTDVDSKLSGPTHEVDQQTKHFSQDGLETVIHDSWFNLQASSQVTLNSTLSQCLEAKSHCDSDIAITSETGKLQGQFPSYRDTEGSVFGCKHYKQNCKLVATCCNRIFTCRRCHDEEIHDHAMDRKSTAQMMCMKCLEIQPIGRTCSTPSCNEYSMARFYCRFCRLFDDEREIYHCPYCNLCRVGKGLGIDYFHCMKCNACMGRSLTVHKCIEKCIEDKCPICQEDMFTSTDPVKSLNCGHVMHSTCFQDYTCMKYTCPICSKSLGDMQVYFKMLDALLAEEKMPEEYSGQTQGILCNDCANKGTAPFHWLYHKCSCCGSYNTRLL
ncbi:hypothetical protein KSS87_021889 [Heliosperma pusillum]|nr:hypothetical protein KSS87_021889 [Heliosperma pusillum]